MPANELAKDGPTLAPTRRSISPQPPALPSLPTDGPPKEPIKPTEKLVEKENPTEDKPPALPESTPKSTPLEPVPEPEEDKDDGPDTDLIDQETFNQLLELDEDEDSHDFSQPMVWDYFEQAVRTFEDMDKAFAAKDLKRLSELGHFLKGSSAALGLSRVKNTCEKIQNTGKCHDEETGKELSAEVALKLLAKLLKRVKVEYNEAQIWLKDFYGNA